MTVSIEKKITGFSVKNEEEQTPSALVQHVEFVSEKMERPETLSGSTIKVKPAMQDKAFYVTINHITLNEGTNNEVVRPFEVFVEGGDVEQSQWVSFATRAITAVFRKGGEYRFIIDQMKETLDPTGGYFVPRGRYANSVVAHIGFVIEDHLKKIGAIAEEAMSAAEKEILEAKKEEYLVKAGDKADDNGFPASAEVCTSCHTKAVILMDGCMVCLQCASSKCS